MCDGKANSDLVVKTDNRRTTGKTYLGTDANGNPRYRLDTEVDPTITDESKRSEYGLSSMKQTSPDVTDKVLRDARANEAMRLRARRGRKSSFLQSDLDWSEQKDPMRDITFKQNNAYGDAW